jgi:DNA mismatch repair protein MutS2
MPFSPGDPVHVAALGKGIVREVRNADRYVVEVKGRSISVDGARLTAIEPPKRGSKKEPPVSQPATASALARTHARSSLDLHGMTTEQATAALDEFVNEAILAGLTHLRVIHGRSGGRLKAAVHARLHNLPVRHFRLDPSNPGVTIVEL